MQRLLIALPVLLLVAGLAFGGGWFMYAADNTPVPTVAAGALSYEDSGPVLDACAPLDDPEPEVETEPEPQPEPQPRTEDPKPEEKAPETPNEVTNAWRNELEAKLAESGLSEQEMAALRDKMELAIQMMEEQQKRIVKLSGTVSDYSGMPLANAHVFASYSDESVNKDRSRRNALRSMRVGTTDETGAWSGNFMPPAEGDSVTISIYATHEAHMNGEHISKTVTPGESYDSIALGLKQGASITGRVVDQDFNPIAGARVMAYAAGEVMEGSKGGRKRVSAYKYATSDENGNFILGGLEEGTYRVTGTANGFRTGSDMPEITISSGAPTQLGTDVVLNRMTAVKVKLICAERQPAGYASATFYDANGKSRRSGGSIDKDGNLLLSNVLDSAVEFEITVAGYESTGRISLTVYANTHNDAGEVALTWNGQEWQGRKTGKQVGDVNDRAQDLKRALEELEKLKKLKELKELEQRK